jgi:hypothetical protein
MGVVPLPQGRADMESHLEQERRVLLREAAAIRKPQRKSKRGKPQYKVGVDGDYQHGIFVLYSAQKFRQYTLASTPQRYSKIASIFFFIELPSLHRACACVRLH